MMKFFKMALPLVFIASVCAGLLAFTYKKTLTPIKEAQDKAQLEAITEVLGTKFDNNPFEERAILRMAGSKDYLVLYPAKLKNEFVGVAIKTSSLKGFGGKVELIVGFSMDGRINKFKLLNHKETPGLGTKVEGTKFMNQFSGLNPRYANLKVRQDGGDIDAVTAATISSRAVLEAIEKAYQRYQRYKEGE